jgi:phosphate transport system ATP-binding protein
MSPWGFGVRHLKKLSKQEKQEIVEENLRAAALWDEVAGRLDAQATVLSIGQQQRLCLARTLAVQPEVLLLDEPTSSLDPLSSKAIELMMLQLKQQYTIIFVTHNIQQARRIADDVVFLCLGKVIESGTKEKMFSCPEKPETREYLTSEYCDCS